MSKKHDEVILEAKTRFNACESWESNARTNWLEDVRFAEGDEYNDNQWPDFGAGMSSKIRLTVNQIKIHNNHIKNSALQNKQGMQIRPVGGGADYASAQIMEAIVRHIENISNAQEAYATASYGMIFGGIGYWRLKTDYVSYDSNEQEVYVERIGDPLSVYLDKDCATYDKSDARYGFVFEAMPKAEFKQRYPQYKDIGSSISALGDDASYTQTGGWEDKDTIRVCDYYRKVFDADALYALPDGTTMLRSELKELDLWDSVKDKAEKLRDTFKESVEQFKIAGSEVVEETIWPGKYIPIVACIGEETIIDGILDRKGHTRALLSPQRMINYFNSAAAEHVALQTKSPWSAAVSAVEGFEEDYENANVQNKAILYWNHIDDNGEPIPQPIKIPPPVMASAYVDGIKISNANMFAASGLQAASLGEESNERSGKAINARQRQAENATYHFTDHLGNALRLTARMIIDLIPHIYDTPRVIRILGDTSQKQAIQIDPDHPVAATEVGGVDPESYDPMQISHIFNPSVGRYEVVADVGPDYATRRQEEFNALSQVIQEVPGLVDKIGDVWADASDFPGADILAQRFRNTMSPQLLGKGPSQQEMEMHQAIAVQKTTIDNLKHEIMLLKTNHATERVMKGVDAYKAETDRASNIYQSQTDRLKAAGSIDPESLKIVVKQMVMQLMSEVKPMNVNIIQSDIEMHNTLQNVSDMIEAEGRDPQEQNLQIPHDDQQQGPPQ